LLVNTFPVELTKKIDLCTLKLENAGFIDEELKEYYADLVFTCTYQDKERIKVTLLLEHKSTKERYPKPLKIRVFQKKSSPSFYYRQN